MKGYIEKRKWGKFEIIDEGENFKVKRLTIKSGEGTSYQYHIHRDESWIVVSGTACIINQDGKIVMEVGDILSVSKMEKHKISNYLKKDLIMIEVWHGDVLEEDDIVRLDENGIIKQ